MNTKQRDVVFQKWLGSIVREARDLASLEQIAARAMSDREVSDDAELQGMISSEVARRRQQLEQDLQDDANVRAASPKPTSRSDVPEPARMTSPKQDREEFGALVAAFREAVEDLDVDAAEGAVRRMRDIAERRAEDVDGSALDEAEVDLGGLRTRMRQIAEHIEARIDRAIAAAKKGDEEALAAAMKRLAAIHVAHPCVLTEEALDEVRTRVAAAAYERTQHLATTKKLLDRERAITRELGEIGRVIRAFHRVARTAPPESDAWRAARAKYLKAIGSLALYDNEWFTGVVLEMADVLAEWSAAPAAAEDHIDRFLDGIRSGLSTLRRETDEFDAERPGD